MTNNKKSEQPKERPLETNKIRDLGWIQGSVFLPISSIQSPYKFDPNDQVLVITTQSCSVVSQSFDRDPLVEAVVATKLSKFNERNHEAIGKNQRKLHIQTEKSTGGCSGLECDINKRFFFDRKALLEFSPMLDLTIGNREVKKLARWIGRSYTRIALPDELVANMRQNLLPLIEKALTHNHEDQSLHSEVSSIYISWIASKENTTTHSFALSLIFMCKSQAVADLLDEILNGSLNDFLNSYGKDNLHINQLRCGVKNDTFVSDLDDHDRLSEWDYLTGLGGSNWFLSES